MNIPALIGAGGVNAGIAAMMILMTSSSSSMTFVEFLRDCLFAPSLYWECFEVRVEPDNFDHWPTTAFLHVPVLDDTSEIVSTPTGKGASR